MPKLCHNARWHYANDLVYSRPFSDAVGESCVSMDPWRGFGHSVNLVLTCGGAGEHQGHKGSR